MIMFYHKGRYVKKYSLSESNLEIAITWVLSGGDVKVGGKLINDVQYLNEFIKPGVVHV